MSWGAIFTNVAGSYFSISEAYNKSKIIEAENKLNITLAGIEARSMERSATQTENQGVRAAMIEQHKTKMVTSDAVAAMAAGGGGIDAVELMKIKQRGDFNSMSAIFDARTRAIDLRFQADMTRIGATVNAGSRQRYADSLTREAKTGAIFNSMDMFASAYSPKTSTRNSPYAKNASGGRITQGGREQ